MTESKSSRNWFRWLVDLLVVVIFAMLTWAGSVLWEMTKQQAVMSVTLKTTVATVAAMQAREDDHAKRTADIEIWKASTSGNRFTMTDGHELWREMSDLKLYVQKLPLGDPPNWFVDRVDGLSERIDRLETRVNGAH